MINKIRAGDLYDSISKSNEEREFLHWHASSIGICPRAHYLKRLGQKPISQPAAGKILRWQAGHSIEEAIRQHVNKVYGKTDSNVRLTSEKLDLTGEYDNLTAKDKRLIEIKSVHDLAFYDKGGELALKEDTGEKGPRGGVVYKAKETPYLHHELQNHGYVLLLKETGIDVANIDYIYVALGGRLCVYTTKVNPNYLQWVEDRLELLRTAWKTKTPPACLCKEYDSPLYNLTYKWCDYLDEINGTCCELGVNSGRD